MRLRTRIYSCSKGFSEADERNYIEDIVFEYR